MQFEIKTNVRPARVAAVSRRGMVREEVAFWELTRNTILRLSVRKARLKMWGWCNCTAEWRRTTWEIEFE